MTTRAGSPFVPRVDRVNRLVLAGLGVACVAAGVLALLAGAGVFGAGIEERHVLGPGIRGYAASHGWFWPVVALASAAVAVLALGWLLAQRGTGRMRGLDLVADETGGVRLAAAALTAAVEADVTRIDGVDGARAALRGRRRPLLEITVALSPGVDVTEVRDEVEGPVLGRARRAVGRPDLPAQVDLTPGTRVRRTVR